MHYGDIPPHCMRALEIKLPIPCARVDRVAVQCMSYFAPCTRIRLADMRARDL